MLQPFLGIIIIYYFFINRYRHRKINIYSFIHYRAKGEVLSDRFND